MPKPTKRTARTWVRWIVMWQPNWPGGTLHGTRKSAVAHANVYGVEPVTVIKVTVVEVLPRTGRKGK